MAGDRGEGRRREAGASPSSAEPTKIGDLMAALGGLGRRPRARTASAVRRKAREGGEAEAGARQPDRAQGRRAEEEAPAAASPQDRLTRGVPVESSCDLPDPAPAGAGGCTADRVVPMQPTQVDAPFDDPAYFFEPWWPGVRAFAWIDGGRLVRLQAEGMADATAAFPELAELLEPARRGRGGARWQAARTR